MASLGRGAERAWWLSWLAALLVHASGASTASLGSFEISSFVELVQLRTAQRLDATIDIEEEPQPEEEPEPQPEPEPKPEEEPESQPETPPEPPPPLPTEEPLEDTQPEEAPPPAAAEAAKVLTAEPTEDAPLDLTEQGFISGTGTRFAGGVTASAGTSTRAVRNPNAQAGGVSGGTGTKPAPSVKQPAIDKSRPASRGNNDAYWSSCPFPPEADVENQHQARVQLVVNVSKEGKPTSVTILSDPGYGFARATIQCAMRYRGYQVALDKWGNPVASATRPFTLRYTR